MIGIRIGFWLSVTLAALAISWTVFDIMSGRFTLSPGFIDQSLPRHIKWALSVVRNRHWPIPTILGLTLLSVFCCWKMGHQKFPLIPALVLLVGAVLAASAHPLAYLILYKHGQIGPTLYTDTGFYRSLLPAFVYFLVAVVPLAISGLGYLIARRRRAQAAGTDREERSG